MNFFPNLQVHIRYTDSNQSQYQTQRTRTRDPINFQNLISNFLRQNGGFEDIQIIFGIDHNQPTTTTTQQGLRIEDLNQFTELILSSELTENEICSICRNNFNDNEIIRKINSCQHLFHQQCLDSWLSRNITCPMCRNNIYPNTQSN
jgi:hypothetical protein